MNLNETPSGERAHIAFFGARNAGKSSLVNAVTGQRTAIVSPVKGTTTDPVRRAMELLPLGPVVIIDTPGYDDEGELGRERVNRMKRVLERCDIAVMVVDGAVGETDGDRRMLTLIRERGIPFLTVWNKADLNAPPADGALAVSATTGLNVSELRERLGRLAPAKKERPLARDLVSPGGFCVLVCPIDESAPRGRLILPQQQTVRDLMDHGSIPVVCRDTELKTALSGLNDKPDLVITDSQAFATVKDIVPEDIPLTSFSVLMARYKGFLRQAVEGVSVIASLVDGDRILMAEGCSHHRQCNDIGTVKIPGWLRTYTKKDIRIDTYSGQDFPEDLTPYRLVIHCGGCMLTEATVRSRMRRAIDQGVPLTNYGIAIARVTGALERCLRPMPELHALIAEDRR